MKSEAFLCVAIVGAITARQEEVEWWLRNTAALAAIVASIVTIWLKLRPPRARKDLD